MTTTMYFDTKVGQKFCFLTYICAKRFALSTLTLIVCILAVLFSIDTFAQIKKVQQPKFETVQPTNTGYSHTGYYFNSNLTNPASQTNTSAYSPPMGGKADDIIQQQNDQAMKMMGHSLPVVPPSDPYLARQFILNQYNQSRQFQQLKEVQDAINEIHAENSSHPFHAAYFKSPEFAEKTKHYYDALAYLQAMATGKIPMSLKDAYYQMESAYGNPYLTKKEFDAILKESGEFIKTWMRQNGLDYTNQEAKHLTVQHFLSDTLVIYRPTPDSKSPPKKKTHYPFQYDYQDFKGEKDHRNYFVTKSLATGTGQCNSLPTNYLLLCEQIGAKTYLSLAPLHALIKYPDNKGTIHNYEPTTNWNMNDQEYSDLMGITPQARKSGIYLDTLGNEAILADCMLQLAFGYSRKYGIGDEKFLTDCINYSIKTTGKQKLIHAYFLVSDYYAIKLDNLLTQRGIKDLNEIDKIPEAKYLHDKYIETAAAIQKLGYQDMPPALYEGLMHPMDKKGRIQQDKKINTKEKRSLFAK